MANKDIKNQKTELEKQSRAQSKSVQKLNQYLEDSKNKSYFVGLMTLGFLLIFMFAGVIPAYRAVLSQNQENQEIQEAIDDINKKNQDLVALVNYSEANSNLVDYFAEVFPEGYNEDRAVEKIYTYADDTNLFIKSINFPEIRREFPLTRIYKVSAQVQSIKLTISAEGTSQSILNFIDRMEDSRQIFNVEAVSLRKKTGDELQNAGAAREYELLLDTEFFYYSLDSTDINN